MKTLTIFCGTALAASICAANAQAPAAMQQVDSMQQRRQLEQSAQAYETGESAPEFFPGESSDVGPQSVLKIKPRRTWIEAMADAQYFYTDNMFLNEHDEEEADVLVSAVQLALAPTAYDLTCGQFAPRVGYRHQWFVFGPLSDRKIDGYDFSSGNFRRAPLDEFDFNAQTIFADGRWTHGNWLVEVGFDHTRLLDSGNYDQFYDEYTPRWGLQRAFPLCERASFVLGYSGDYRFTDTDAPPPSFDEDYNDRMDHALFGGLNVALCPRAILQPFYRFTWTHFTSGLDRDDALHSFGLTLLCPITRQISVRGFAGYDIKDSQGSESTDDYNRMDLGGGVNLTFRF